MGLLEFFFNTINSELNSNSKLFNFKNNSSTTVSELYYVHRAGEKKV